MREHKGAHPLHKCCTAAACKYAVEESAGNGPDVMAYMGTNFSILQLNEWRFKSYNTYTRVVEDHTDLHFNCRKGVVVWQLK